MHPVFTYSGDPHEKVDLAFIAEGYAAEDKDKFKTDTDRFAGYLFGIEPYKSARDKFNVYGVLRPSPERAMDEPRQGVYKKTVLNASFNAFDLDRYMLIEKDHRLHEITARVPYDAIIVLVNSKRYGGGSIGFDYCVTTVDHASSRRVFVHELGHSFAGLADEYYASEVAYNDFYPKGEHPFNPMKEFESHEPGNKKDDPIGFEAAIRGLFRGFDGLERLSKFDRYPNLTVYPLAVFRDIYPKGKV
ncbi:MAG: M64 family metallopeptidase [Candidatus Aminicenantales bacterium]